MEKKRIIILYKVLNKKMIDNEKMEMINIKGKDGKIQILQKDILHDIIYSL